VAELGFWIYLARMKDGDFVFGNPTLLFSSVWGFADPNYLRGLETGGHLPVDSIRAYCALISKEFPGVIYIDPAYLADLMSSRHPWTSLHRITADIILAPFQVNLGHWILVIIYLQHKSIRLYDSAGQSRVESDHSTMLLQFK